MIQGAKRLIIGNRLKMLVCRAPKYIPEDIVFVAVRDLEKPENYLVNKYNVNFIEMEDVKKAGPAKIAEKALQMLDHCDLDLRLI